MIQQIKKPFIFITMGVIVLLLIVNFAFFIKNSINSSISEKIEYYYTTWNAFRKLSGTELHAMWNNKYHDAFYQWNGDAKYNAYDCTSAVYWLLKDLKSNYTLCTVDDLFNKLNFVSYKRQSFASVETKDLIIIYIKNAWHVGIVEGKSINGMINYMDMNIANMGAGYKQAAFGSSIIKGIYPITFELWIGDLLKSLEMTKPKEEPVIKNIELKKEVSKIERKKETEIEKKIDITPAP